MSWLALDTVDLAEELFFFFNGPFFLGMSLTGPPLVSAEPPIPYRHLQAA